ncbi:MAG: hypothetical protein ACREX4_24195 [Gammaproteobacteria bacterium]
MKPPATLASPSVRVLPTPLKIELKSLDDVRLEMARVYRDMRGERIHTADGTRLVYMFSQIGRVIEGSQVQQRIEALQRVLNRRPKP